MSQQQLNRFELQACRRGLGLSAAEFAALPSINVSQRAVNYWQTGRYTINEDVESTTFQMRSHYTLLLQMLEKDISNYHKKNPRPLSDDPDQYFKMMQDYQPLTLPYFSEIEDMDVAIGCSSQTRWRIWQAAVSHYFMTGKISGLSDESVIPSYFSCLSWLSGDYEHTDFD